jgi:hypothetical protein
MYLYLCLYHFTLLKLEHLLRCVAQLLECSLQLSLPRPVLGTGKSLDLTRRPANKRHDLVVLLGEDLLDHIRRHEARFA